MKLTPYLHSHIYFELSHLEQAALFRKKIIEELGSKVRVSRMIHEPIGPHPLPMFEADFRSEDYETVKKFLTENKEPTQSILIHQLSGDEIWDHTEGAEFLGPPIALDLQFLKDFMAGRVAAVSDKIHKK